MENPLGHSGEKIGPLPVYAWGGLIGIAVVGLVYFRRNKSAQSAAGATASTAPGDPTNPNSDFTAANLNDLIGSSGGLDVSNGVVPDSVSDTMDTNFTWLAKSITYLSGTGASPLTVQTALQKYIGGEGLTAEERALADQAVGKFGLPPEGTPVATTSSPAASTAGWTGKLVRNTSDGAIYAVMADGTKKHLDAAEYANIASSAIKGPTGQPYTEFTQAPGTVVGAF